MKPKNMFISVMLFFLFAILFATAVDAKTSTDKSAEYSYCKADPGNVTGGSVPVLSDSGGPTQQAGKETTMQTSDPAIKAAAPLPDWTDKILLYLKYFIESTIGINALRFLIRYIPSRINMDFVGWGVKLLNLLWGGYIKNRDDAGGVFKRNYSLTKE